MKIHPTAQIGPEAVIGPGTVVCSNAVIAGRTRIGRNNYIRAGARIGESPMMPSEDSFGGVSIGDGNTIGEFCVIHCGTRKDETTMVGNGNWLGPMTHIGHDSVVGNTNTFCIGAKIAGHCNVDDHCYLAMNSTVIPFKKVGKCGFLGAGSVATKDIEDGCRYFGVPAANIGPNIVGIERAGLDWRKLTGNE